MSAAWGTPRKAGAELAAGPLRIETIVVLSGGSLAGNADLRQTEAGAWQIHGDPTEAAFLVAERKLGVTERRERRFERVGEIPFTSERKLMTTIERDHEHGDSLVAITKGAPDVRNGCGSTSSPTRHRHSRWVWTPPPTT